MSNTIQLQNGMTVETLTFSVTCILEGALDILQMGMPDSLDNATREMLVTGSGTNYGDMTDWERGAVDGAIAAVAIIGAQTIGDGIGNSDADQLLGDFSETCRRYVASNWKNRGEDFRARQKKLMEKGGFHYSELALDYPKADEIAKRFVTDLGLLPE